MFADEIRLAIEASNRITLPAVTALLWRAYGEGKVSEAEAEALSGLIEARRTAPTNLSAVTPIPDRLGTPKRAVGSRPRSDASMERRRRWAASGRLPPGLAARFTLAEQAALSLIAAETARRGDCRLSIPHMAALVGVAETTVRNAIREARGLGLLTVEERRLTGFRNDTNVVRIISPEWAAWLRLARKAAVSGAYPSPAAGGGCKSTKGTPTQVSTQGKTRMVGPSQRPTASLNPSSQEVSRTAGARPRRCAVKGTAPGPR